MNVIYSYNRNKAKNESQVKKMAHTHTKKRKENPVQYHIVSTMLEYNQKKMNTIFSFYNLKLKHSICILLLLLRRRRKKIIHNDNDYIKTRTLCFHYE